MDCFDQEKVKYATSKLLTKTQLAMISCQKNYVQCLDGSFDKTLLTYFNEFLAQAHKEQILDTIYAEENGGAIEQSIVATAKMAFLYLVKKNAQILIDEALNKTTSTTSK